MRGRRLTDSPGGPPARAPDARRAPGGIRGRLAFSLLEVMVVSAIVALLLAILVPSLSAARRQARRTLCSSNAGQLARAWHMYLNDHRGLFPRGTTIELTYGGKQGIGSANFGANPRRPVVKPLNRYLGLPLVTRDAAEPCICPEDIGTRDAQPTAHAYYGTSYKTNPILIGQGALKQRGDDPCLAALIEPLVPRIRRITRSQLNLEPKLILIGDLGWEYMWDYANPERVNWHGRRGFYTIAFMDGHVSFTRIRKGIHVDAAYSVVPFRDLQAAALSCQAEVPDEP